MLDELNLEQFWGKICVTLKIRVACFAFLALRPFFYFLLARYSSSIQGKTDINLHDILRLVTGAPSVLFLEFQQKLTIDFVHDFKKLQDKECNCKPTTSTFVLSLNLAIHNKSQKWYSRWQKQFVCFYGFRKV